MGGCLLRRLYTASPAHRKSPSKCAPSLLVLSSVFTIAWPAATHIRFNASRRWISIEGCWPQCRGSLQPMWRGEMSKTVVNSHCGCILHCSQRTAVSRACLLLQNAVADVEVTMFDRICNLAWVGVGVAASDKLAHACLPGCLPCCHVEGQDAEARYPTLCC